MLYIHTWFSEISISLITVDTDFGEKL